MMFVWGFRSGLAVVVVVGFELDVVVVVVWENVVVAERQLW